MFKVPPYRSKYPYCISFYAQIIFHCVDRYFIDHNSSLSIHQLMDILVVSTFKSFDERCYLCASFCIDILSVILGTYLIVKLLWNMVSLSLVFLYLFVYVWLQGVSVAERALNSSCRKWGYSPLQCTGFSVQWLLLLQSTGSRACRLQQFQHTDSVVQCTGLVAPRHVGSSQTKDQTHVPYVGRLILNHQTTREVPKFNF